MASAQPGAKECERTTCMRVYHTKVLLYKGIIDKCIIRTKVLLNKGIFGTKSDQFSFYCSFSFSFSFGVLIVLV